MQTPANTCNIFIKRFDIVAGALNRLALRRSARRCHVACNVPYTPKTVLLQSDTQFAKANVKTCGIDFSTLLVAPFDRTGRWRLRRSRACRCRCWAASSLQAQLSSVQSQLRAFADSVASVGAPPSSASSSADPLLSLGYQRLPSTASPADCRAAAVAAIAASLSSHTFKPAATQV